MILLFLFSIAAIIDMCRRGRWMLCVEDTICDLVFARQALYQISCISSPSLSQKPKEKLANKTPKEQQKQPKKQNLHGFPKISAPFKSVSS